MINNLKENKKEEQNRKYKQLKEENKTLHIKLNFIEESNMDILSYLIKTINFIDKINILIELYDKLLNDYDFIKFQEKKMLLERLKKG